MIKSMTLLVRRSDQSHEEFVQHWVEVHAPLFLAIPGLRRYVQHRAIGEGRSPPHIPPVGVEIDGIAEMWWEDRAAMERAQAMPEWRACAADGALFIGQLSSFTTEDNVVIPPEA